MQILGYAPKKDGIDTEQGRYSEPDCLVIGGQRKKAMKSEDHGWEGSTWDFPGLHIGWTVLLRGELLFLAWIQAPI